MPGNGTGFTQNIACYTSAPKPTIDPNTNRFESGQGYAFDKNGNLVTDPVDSGRSFVFNGDNKQKEVRGPSNELIGEYFYDGEGERVKKHRYVGGVLTEVTVFVYSAGKLTATNIGFLLTVIVQKR